MTTEETKKETAQETTKEIPKEPGQFLALLEKVEKEQRGLAETHLGHVQHLAATERTFEARFKQVEHEIKVLDVKLSGKIRTLDAKVGKLDAKIDALDKKLDAKVGALAIGIERIAAHLGLGTVIPAGPPAESDDHAAPNASSSATAARS